MEYSSPGWRGSFYNLSPGKARKTNNTAISHVGDVDSDEACLVNDPWSIVNVFGAERVWNWVQKPVEDRKNSDFECENVDDRAVLASFMTDLS